MRLSISRGLKLIAVCALLLIILCGYLTFYDVNFFGPVKMSCRDRGKEIKNRLSEQVKKQKTALRDVNKEIRKLKSELAVASKHLQSLIANSSCQLSSSSSTVGSVEQQTCNVTSFQSQLLIDGQISRNEKQPVFSKQQVPGKEFPSTRSNHELEAIRWESFTLEHVYHIENVLFPQPMELFEGAWKEELSLVLDFSVNILNKEIRNKTRKFLLSDFVEGYRFCDKSRGVFYDLYFRSVDQAKRLRYLRLSRLFAPLQRILKDARLVDHSKTTINVILPLQEKLQAFKQFLQMFHLFSLNQEVSLFLTVVYFGENGLKDAKKVLTFMASSVKYQQFQFLSLKSETFSRKRAMQHAVEKWDGGNAIMLFADLEVVFDISFIHRCQMNTIAGKRVYFPIVFGLYNPNVVYVDKMIPGKYRQLVHTVQTGSWRIDSYRIVCQYRDDFIKVNQAFTSEWGQEGVGLFWRYRCSGFQVMRVCDRALFYWFQEHVCDVGQSVDEYRDCIEKKALVEVSHRQIGLLAFQSNGTIRR